MKNINIHIQNAWNNELKTKNHTKHNGVYQGEKLWRESNFQVWNISTNYQLTVGVEKKTFSYNYMLKMFTF